MTRISLPCLQVFGMFAVTATAVGCAMFLDDGNIISTVGSSAIATLLLILNVAFLAADQPFYTVLL